MTALARRWRAAISAGAAGAILFACGASASPLSTEFPAPAPASGPCEVSVDASGHEWVEQITADDIGRIDPRTGAYTTFSIPTPGGVPAGTRLGPDGSIWFPEFGGGKIASIDTATGHVSEYVIPGMFPLAPGTLPLSDDIIEGPDHAMWFTENGVNAIGRIDPQTHAINEFPIPTEGAAPLNIDVGPNGTVVFPEYGAGKVGQLDVYTHRFTEYAVPGGTSSLPFYVTLGADGAIWFDTHGTNVIGHIDPVTHAITTDSVKSATQPWPAPGTILSAADGNLWLNLGGLPFPGPFATAANIARFDIRTRRLTVFKTPGVCDLQFGVPAGAVGTRAPDTVMWGGEFGGNKVLAFDTAAADALVPAG
jgi:virginiamycin B lyase